MGKKDQIRAEPDREPRDQCGALPWRLTAGKAVEVLLITSRDTRRWVIPKGWPIKGLNAAGSAEREAFEEAGVEGRMGRPKLGVYHYGKRLASGRVQSVKVAVYAMNVSLEADSWPEQGQRDKLWTTPSEAATLVDEPELKALIAAFKPLA